MTNTIDDADRSIRRSGSSARAGSACRRTASRPAGSSSASPPIWLPARSSARTTSARNWCIFRTESGQGQRARRLLPAPRREHGGRRHRRRRAHRLPVARLAVAGRRHQCADPVQQDRLQAERADQDLSRAGVVRLHRGLARTSRPRALLAAAGAARTGDRRVLPAAPAHPDAQPGQGASRR